MPRLTHPASSEHVYAALLEALTQRLIEIAGTERELVARAEVDPAEMEKNQRRLARAERKEAARELDAFRAAIEDARTRGRDGVEFAYDGSDATQGPMADALIQYLVRPGYASVRTEEPAEGRYVYHLQVDWPKPRVLAAELGHTLD
jgi:hypothetical protein